MTVPQNWTTCYSNIWSHFISNQFVVSKLFQKKILQKNDHLVISIEQHRKAGAYVTIYFSCVPKGRFTMPYSLREMVEKNSKVKLYHGEDLEIQVSSKEWPFTRAVFDAGSYVIQSQCGKLENFLSSLKCSSRKHQMQLEWNSISNLHYWFDFLSRQHKIWLIFFQFWLIQLSHHTSLVKMIETCQYKHKAQFIRISI